MKSSIGGLFNLEGLEAKPIMIEDKEAYRMKVFLGLGPYVIILSVRIGLGKAYDHSLLMHSSCMFNVCMRYVC